MPQATPSVPKQSIQIRPATAEDAPSIAALGSHVFATTFGYSLPPSDLAASLSSSYSLAAIEADLANPHMSTLVASPAHNPSLVLGSSQLTRHSYEPCLEGSPKPVELQRLYVSTEAHGLGVGRRLVEGIEGIAQEEGWETLWLGVWEDNVKAHGFYRKMGLEKCGFHDFVMVCVMFLLV
jgi:ribosomal protein S18 acetylase RimI-like enzyme